MPQLAGLDYSLTETGGFDVIDYVMRKPGAFKYDSHLLLSKLPVPVIEIRRNDRALFFDWVKIDISVTSSFVTDENKPSSYDFKDTVRQALEMAVAEEVAIKHEVDYKDGNFVIYGPRLGFEFHNHHNFFSRTTSPETQTDILDRIYRAGWEHLGVITSTEFGVALSEMHDRVKNDGVAKAADLKTLIYS